VARYLIFHNIQTMLAKQYNVPSASNQWHGMKGSGSRHTIWITDFFAAADFQEHYTQQQQKFSFSGVGAKHQNGIPERNIKTVVQWACANMLHLATHWPAEAHKRYWPQAIDYAV
jgi:hypothetical protein